METVDAGDSLSSAFRRILGDFRKRYVLYFAPEHIEGSVFHALDVRVKRDGAEVHARRGYLAR